MSDGYEDHLRRELLQALTPTYTVWIEIPVPSTTTTSDASAPETLAAVLLAALREAGLEPQRFTVEQHNDE